MALLPAPLFAAPTITVLGDSLSAGYGLAAEEAFPVQLQAALQESHPKATVIGLGISGDTTAGGRARIESAIEPKPDLILIALGANDMLRGLPPKQVETNLRAMIEAIRNNSQAKILLIGMRASPSFGPAYGQRFNAIFPALAQEYDTFLYPFFLEGVAMNPALNLPDRLHPNREGIRVMVENILPTVKKALE